MCGCEVVLDCDRSLTVSTLAVVLVISFRRLEGESSQSVGGKSDEVVFVDLRPNGLIVPFSSRRSLIRLRA